MYVISGLVVVLIALWLVFTPIARAASPSKPSYSSKEFQLLWTNKVADKVLPYRIIRTTRETGDGRTEQNIQFKQQDQDWTLFALSYDGRNPVNFVSLQNYGMFERKHRGEINRLLEQIKAQKLAGANQADPRSR